MDVKQPVADLRFDRGRQRYECIVVLWQQSGATVLQH